MKNVLRMLPAASDILEKVCTLSDNTDYIKKIIEIAMLNTLYYNYTGNLIVWGKKNQLSLS